jgi:nuclear pore complex protein Nup98-Nup96
LRLKDYEQNRKFPSAAGTGGAFGTAFGQQPLQQQPQAGAFGAAGGGAFGAAQPSSVFGGTTSAFGGTGTTATTGGFGTTNGGLFGQQQQQVTGTSAFGTATGGATPFGAAAPTSAFGQQPSSTAGGLFGSAQPAGTSAFGTGGAFGQPSTSAAGTPAFGKFATQFLQLLLMRIP